MNTPHMSIQATAFWSDHGKGQLIQETLPEPGDSEVQVAALFSGISKGTETLVFRGGVPESEHARMRAPFQQGDFSAAVKYGYCSVGRVVQAPKGDLNDEPSPWLDQRVFCLYPHQDRYVVPVSAVHPIPDAIPSERAVLTANMETAVNGLIDAGLDRAACGDQRHAVTVIGAGVVGCLVAHVCHQHGHDVELVDTQPSRQGLAEQLGVGFAQPAKAQGERDVVIHTSASEAGLRHALTLARQDGRIVEMSWFGDHSVTLPLGEAFHAKRLTLRSSQVGHIAPERQDVWTHESRLAHAFEMLTDPRLDALITHRAPFADLPAVMARLSDGADGVLCQLIDYA